MRDAFCMLFNQQNEVSTMKGRLENLEELMTNQTVLEDWFTPAKDALEKIRPPRSYPTLSNSTLIMLNCVRQIMSSTTLRDYIQHLFHLNEEAFIAPLARSTYSDALSHSARLSVTEQLVNRLAEKATQSLPDRLKGLEGLGNRSVYAIDGTYQEESSHFTKITPSQGGDDNSKGHLLLTIFNLRYGVPMNIEVETSSISEIKLLKERRSSNELTTEKNALWIVDRAFIDALYWDERKENHSVTMITRMKSNLNYQVVEKNKVTTSNKRQGITSDEIIQLDSSKYQWRLIGYWSESGEYYQYLTNDFELTPGVIAFLYHRRWDEEKYFDNFKNDMASTKAWGKSRVAIKQQALAGMITFILTKLFCLKHSINFEIKNMDGDTQSKRHLEKIEKHLDRVSGDEYRAFHTSLSKITKQIWRFLKGCMLKRSKKKLYETQLKPLMLAYM